MAKGPLSGQVALVTGGAHRLGRALAEALVADGAAVGIHFRQSADAAEKLAETLRAGGGEAFTLDADLADPDAVDRLLPRAAERSGPVDLLVNNASIFAPTSLAETDRAALEENAQVNAWAPLSLARALADQKRPGQVLNLLDTRVTAATDPTHLAYYLSKRTLADVTRLLALELGPHVRVNGVAPGAVLAPADAPPGYLERLGQTLPLQRTGGPADIVAAARYLWSAPFVTGQVIFVDGGQHLQGAPHV